MDAFKERLKIAIKHKSKHFRHMRETCKIAINILSNGVIIVGAKKSYFILAQCMDIVDSIYRGFQSPGEILLTSVENSQYEIICAVVCEKVTQGICYQFRRGLNNGEFVYLCRSRYELLSRSKYITLVGSKTAVIGPHSAELGIISIEPTTVNINAISECILFSGRDRLERNYILTKRGSRYYINPKYEKCINNKEYVNASTDKAGGEITSRYLVLYGLDGLAPPFIYNINTQTIMTERYEYSNMYGDFEIIYNNYADPLKQIRWNDMTKIVKVRLCDGSYEYYAKCGNGLKAIYCKFAEYMHVMRKYKIYSSELLIKELTDKCQLLDSVSNVDVQ